MRRLSFFGIVHSDFLAPSSPSRARHVPPGPHWKSRPLLGLIPAILACTLCSAASAQVPDAGQSFFVPQAGSVASPLEGASAVRFFRACPNNDGVSSLPNNARIKIVLRDASGSPVVGYSRVRVYVLFNGGTAAQGFGGPGADSIIANGTYNTSPLCPDVTKLFADADTDIQGQTYITFAGSSATPGVAERNPNRKWGHYDSDVPVFVEPPSGPPEGLSGRLTASSPSGSYALRIKNVDAVGGLTTVLNQGERVTSLDFNPLVSMIGSPSPPAISYWLDYDNSGAVNSVDFNILVFHFLHTCATPLNP